MTTDRFPLRRTTLVMTTTAPIILSTTPTLSGTRHTVRECRRGAYYALLTEQLEGGVVNSQYFKTFKEAGELLSDKAREENLGLLLFK